MSSARDFRIAISDADIKGLQAKLRNARLHEPLEGVGWEYGMHSQVMKDFVEYWANDFDWGKQVSIALRRHVPTCMPMYICSHLSEGIVFTPFDLFFLPLHKQKGGFLAETSYISCIDLVQISFCRRGI